MLKESAYICLLCGYTGLTNIIFQDKVFCHSYLLFSLLLKVRLPCCTAACFHSSFLPYPLSAGLPLTTSIYYLTSKFQ